MGDLLKGPITSVIEAIGGVIGNFVQSPDEKAKAQLELMKVGLEFQAKVLQAEVEYAKQAASVITTEAGSKNVLASSWRPILMLTFTYIILHNFVLAPLFHFTVVPIPPDMWDLLRLGVGGYVIGRSAEKVLPEVTKVLKK
jgi:hypothetical protein